MSSKRVNSFLQLQELDLEKYYGRCLGPHPPGGVVSVDNSPNVSEEGCSSIVHQHTDHAVSIRDGSFTWTRAEEEEEHSNNKNSSDVQPLSEEERTGQSNNVCTLLCMSILACSACLLVERIIIHKYVRKCRDVHRYAWFS